jgi:hypothetical protein
MANTGRRPSIEDQIKEARAPKGSPLEKVIRDNQDFSLLQPEELTDNFPIPLWLRVFWRKQHPDVQMPAKNPGAAYPEILSQLHKRMVADPHHPWGSGTPQGSPVAPRRRGRTKE